MKHCNERSVKYVFCFFFCFMAISSCTKDKPDESEIQEIGVGLFDVIEYYYKLTTTKVDGKFIFESNLCDNEPSNSNIVTAGGAFYDKQGNIVNNGGTVVIGTMTVPNHNGTFYIEKAVSQNGLYGTNVKFTIQPPTDILTGTQAADATASIYSPLPINITNIQPGTKLLLKANMSTSLTWNADPANSNGVVIMAEYIPSRSPNRNIASGGATGLIQHSQLVPDNGSYSIPWSFFSDYPPGGHVILWIARGNYAIASTSVYNYKVGGYTAAGIWDVIVPPR